ncbi:MAG: hypothetical protein R3199_01345 [Gemmatimonadota bacterium]|nr:hypothetical protein [Gemmatimonadota bacterium]
MRGFFLLLLWWFQLQESCLHRVREGAVRSAAADGSRASARSTGLTGRRYSPAARRRRPRHPAIGEESPLNETIERLIALQDLLQLKRDIQQASYEELGFESLDEEAIDAEIESLEKEIDPSVLRRYERIAAKYDRPLVPVRKGICYGCFVRFPTAKLSDLEEEEPMTCESCGRLLYRIP